MLSPQAWAAPEGLLSGLTDLSRALITAPAQARAVQDRDAMMQLRQALAEGKLANMGQDLELKRGFLGVQQEQNRMAAEKQAEAPENMAMKAEIDEYYRLVRGDTTELDTLGTPIRVPSSPEIQIERMRKLYPLLSPKVQARVARPPDLRAAAPSGGQMPIPAAPAKAPAPGPNQPPEFSWQDLANVFTGQAPAPAKPAPSASSKDAEGDAYKARVQEKTAPKKNLSILQFILTGGKEHLRPGNP